MRPFRMALAPATFRLHKTDATGLLRDEVFDHPAQSIDQQFGEPFTLRVQARWARSKDQQPAFAGDDHYTFGWLSVSHHVLTAAGLTPGQLKNAQVTGITRLHGIDAEDFIVTEVRPFGHLRGGPVGYKLVLDKHKDVTGSPG